MSLGTYSRVVVSQFLLCSLLWMAGAAAQERPGVITGRVVDRAGAVLQGARVEVLPLGAATATDAQGEFSFSAVTPGSDYTVQVSYVGFATYTSKITVTAGQVTRVEAQLNVASNAEEITVTAERVHGEVEAINRERESDNILQVLPVEVITSLPNTNIADALGRLPSVTLERDEGEGKYVQIRGLEPRLSNVTVNGVNVASPEDVRQIKLDIIPANLVESVEINKTLSANQDGDAIGGSVNLVTKQAEEKPTLYVNGIGGYTPIIGGRSLYEVDGTVGKRFGASKKLGVLFGSSYDWNGRGINDVEPAPTVIACDSTGNCSNPDSKLPQTNFATYSTQDWRDYRYYRTRYGFTGNVDYKLGEISGIYIRGIYSHFDNFGDRWVYTPSINPTFDSSGNQTASGWLTPGLTDNNGSMSYNAEIRRPVQVIGSLDAGGKHVFTKWLLSYDVSASRASSEDHGYSTAGFSGPTGIQFAIDTTHPLRPKFIPQGGASIYDPSTYALSSLDIGRTYEPQLNLQAGASVARNYTVGGHFSTFEFGFKLRNVHKFKDQLDPVYNYSGAAPLLNSQVLGSFTDPNYYDKNYTVGPTTDYSKLLAAVNGNPANFTVDPIASALDTFGNSYDLIERVTAGYFMNTVNLGRFRVVAGLRFEATNEDLRGYNVQQDASNNPIISPLTRNSSYLDPLPSVHVAYRLTNDATLRAAYGRGLSRPNYGDLPPSFNTTNRTNEIDIGNPNLKPEYANNYDLLYEQALKPLGLIQAGFFYKTISDPLYEQVKSVLTPALASQYSIPSTFVNGTNILSYPFNGKNAKVYGFEIAYQQHLTFLPGLLGGIGISANYGYTNSSTDGVPLRSDTPPLLRQAPNTWNISPTYDRGRFSARLGISHNDANIFGYGYQNLTPDSTSPTGYSQVKVPLGIKGPLGDTYLYAHTQVDAQGSFRVYRGLQLIVAGLNLTNEVFGFYNGSTIYPIQREFYKTSYEFGLRYTLSNEPK